MPAHLPAPYKVHGRGTDEYGFMSFGANYYWVPGTRRDEVKVLEYSDRLKIFQAGQCLAEYPLPADGVRNAKFSPRASPRRRTTPTIATIPPNWRRSTCALWRPRSSAYLDLRPADQGLGAPSVPAPSAGLEPQDESSNSSSRPSNAPANTASPTWKPSRTSPGSTSNRAPAKCPWSKSMTPSDEREAYQEGSLTDPPDLSALPGTSPIRP